VNPRIEDIPIEEFDLSLAGMRITNPESVTRVHDSMWLHGQLQPVVAREHEGRYQIIDGFKRVYSAMELMIKALQCQVLDIDLQQAKLLILSYNRPGLSLEVWEEAMILKDLLESHDVSQRQLAKLTGHSPSWVSRRLSLISKLDEEVSLEIRSLISKVDEEVAAEIRMGSITSRHARALMRLPRGNQIDIARVITNFGLSSRLSNKLIDAYMEAEDTDQQQQILDHPEPVLWDQPDYPDPPYDDRLSSDGNDLMLSLVNFLRPVRSLLVQLGNPGIEGLNETERMIIDPFLRKVSGYTERLSKVTRPLQIHNKQTN
jgi:ParB/RepB/Spo0J family partition protein